MFKFQNRERDMVTNTNQMQNNATHRPSQVSASLENIVPACPPGLCIIKGDFLCLRKLRADSRR